MNKKPYFYLTLDLAGPSTSGTDQQELDPCDALNVSGEGAEENDALNTSSIEVTSNALDTSSNVVTNTALDTSSNAITNTALELDATAVSTNALDSNDGGNKYCLH